jgi:hypothetical protein
MDGELDYGENPDELVTALNLISPRLGNAESADEFEF